jgi:hypothetical protein
MNLDQLDLPRNLDAERKLLSALLVMLPADRDAAVKSISSIWFSDTWHARFFDVLLRNRRRDFTREHIDQAAYQPDDRAAAWIARLLIDDNGDSVSGRPQLWRQYAHVVEKLYRARVGILLKLEELRDEINRCRSETYSLCDDSIRDAKAIGRTQGP